MAINKDQVTIDLRVLVASHITANDLVEQLRCDSDTDVTETHAAILGVVALDDEGVADQNFAVKPGVKWEGWPRTATHYSMHIFKDPDLNARSEYWQTVKVYAHDGNTSEIVAADGAIIRDGQPKEVRVPSDDELSVFVSEGDWKTNRDSAWTCKARIEPGA